MASRGGVRARTTAVAVLVVGVVLLVASYAMLEFVERSLIAQVADAADLRAQGIAAALAGDDLDVDLDTDPTEEFVQILLAGQVEASSANVAGLDVLADPVADEHVVLDAVPFAPGPYVVTAARWDEVTVIVGRGVDDAVEARDTVGSALLLGAPLLLMLVGGVTWWLTGWALRPVEDIRLEVERISASELDRRVPDPPGSDEIARLATTMNDMLERLEASVDRQRRFVSDASHELRSPVAAIRQHAEVAREHPGTATPREVADAVLVETDRLQALVEDLLLLARLDEGGTPASGEVDLDDLVLADATRVRAAGAVSVDTSAVSTGRVHGSAAQLNRLVVNLVGNASRYATGTVSISLSQHDGQVVLHVDDDGPGIAPEDRSRVFERFVRLDDARGRASGGAGLGLAIAREVARTHGGDVTLDASPLGGLRVEVRLPAAD